MLSTDQGAFIHEGECTASETGPYTGGDSDTYIPPAGCMAWFDGCNSCSRSTKDGPAMCTMMACQGTPQAGYCRTYETPAPPTGGDTPVSSDGGTVSSPPAPAPETPAVVATGTTPEPEKQEIEALLAQLWSYILSLFSLTF